MIGGEHWNRDHELTASSCAGNNTLSTPQKHNIFPREP